MKIIVTGSAGFIGAAVAEKLLERGDEIVGIDNHNNYYDPLLKEARIARLLAQPNYTHVRGDIADSVFLESIFKEYQPKYVVNLAAQAGVRYSQENPSEVIKSNMVGFGNVLECSRKYKIEHLVYASTSSVYGLNGTLPFSIHHSTNHPISLYAATKKSNELMAHTYSHLYQIPMTGLRFFTVYGPWGRPDMALFQFTKSIIAGLPIDVYNHGHHVRDFTYIDDIVMGVLLTLDRPPIPNAAWDNAVMDPATSSAPWRLYNIGNDKPVKLLTYIETLEKCLQIDAIKVFRPLQSGDIKDTHADISDLVNHFKYKANTQIDEGVENFVTWYREFYKV
jgi:UDP-glucuronate 4-epimerase